MNAVLADPLFHVIAAQTLFEHLNCVQLLIDGSDALHLDNVRCAISKALDVVTVLESLQGFLTNTFGSQCELVDHSQLQISTSLHVSLQAHG